MERPDELGADPEVQQIKAEISETQAELQQTVAEIQERLSPANLKDQATNTVREAAGNVREATIGRMHHMINRTNPIPYALIGIGAAWLLASNRSSSRQWNGGYNSDSNRGYSSWGGGESQQGSTEYISTGDRFRSPYAGGAEGGYSGSAYAGGSGAGYSGSGQSGSGDWQESASEVADRARHVAQQARSRWDSMLDDNPMALGIAALAAGALVGASLPQTEVENEYLGETRDQMMESAKSMAQESVDTAKSAATEAVAKVTGTDQQT